jgi:hypothetical protein
MRADLLEQMDHQQVLVVVLSKMSHTQREMSLQQVVMLGLREMRVPAVQVIVVPQQRVQVVERQVRLVQAALHMPADLWRSTARQA